MTSQNMSWQDAVLKVLRDANQPMHYRDIADQIMDREYRSPVANPHNITNNALGQLLKVSGNSKDAVRKIEGEQGMYALRSVAKQINESMRAESEAAKSKGIIKTEAFGLYWDRSAVNWESGSNSLLGQQSKGAQTVDFADQDGIYMLHDDRDIMYVGKTYTPDKENYGLYRRLKAHNDDPRKTVYWNTFSWFGFRPVSEDGQLLQASSNATVESVINVIEAIFIEVLLPRLNQQSGTGMGDAREDGLYLQVKVDF